MAGHNWGAGHPRTSTAAWRRLRTQALARDGHACRGCGAHDVRLEIDHIVNGKTGGTDHLDNLQSLCIPCHKAKTAREAAAARRARAARGRRIPERHPGLR